MQWIVEKGTYSSIVFPYVLSENISLLSCSVCVRFEDGSFIGAYDLFERLLTYPERVIYVCRLTFFFDQLNYPALRWLHFF